jgi:hypothetical protein
MKKTLFFILLFLFPASTYASYSIPSARAITWANKTGLDLIGGVDTTGWTVTIPSGLHADGTTNDATIINNAITAASANTVISIPAGTYLITSNIALKSNVVLRGAGAPYPWLPGGTGGTYFINTGTTSGHFTLGSSKPTFGTAVNISSGYTKGSTTLTLASASGLSTNDIISIYQDNDTALVNVGGCSWCGDDTSGGAHAMQQFARITNVSGNDVTIDPPLYMDYSASKDPEIKKVTYAVKNAGLENFKFYNVGGGGPQITIRSAYSWVKNVETYYSGSSGKQGHVDLEWSFACEVRDSYFHDGRSNDSDRNYAIHIMFWNSGHKIENNIMTGDRHAITFEGGGSGCALLYNYGKDNFESDSTGYLTESMTINHGAHPHMNLWEGNIDQQFYGDFTWGSSSHITLFRNWGLGYRATPSYTYWRLAFRVGPWNRYFNLVGNVAGISSWTSGTGTCATTSECTEPVGYDFNHDTDGSADDSTNPYSTAIMQGNWDYVTDSIAHWADADHTLANSLYYSSTPSSVWWCSEATFPPINSVGPVTGNNPAKIRYEGGTCTLNSGGTIAPTLTGISISGGKVQ